MIKKKKIIFFIVCFALTLYFSVSLIMMGAKKQIWNRHDQFNLAIVDPAKTFLIALNPDQQTVFLVSFPGDLKIRAFGGYGVFKINKIDDLARQENKKELVPKTLEYNFNFPLDFWFFAQAPLISKPSQDIFAQIGGRLRSLAFSMKRLSLSTRINLFLVSISLRNRLLVKEAIEGAEKGFISSGGEGSELKQSEWESWSSVYLADPLLRDERLLVGVYNTAGHAGLATEVAQILVNEGLAVGTVGDSSEKIANCLIAVKGDSDLRTRTFFRLARGLFSSCEVRVMPKEVFENSAEINLYLGKEFLVN